MVDTELLTASDLLPDRGECLALLGRDVTARGVLLSAIVAVSPGACLRIRADDPLFARLDVVGNVGLPLQARRLAANERKRLTGELLALVGLERLAGTRASALDPEASIALRLARGAATGRRHLVLDDLFSGLDHGPRTRLQGAVRRLVALGHSGILLATTERSEALATGDRIGLIERGGVARLASTADLFAEPGSAAIAAEIAGANILDGRIETIDEDDDRDCVVRLPTGRLVAATLTPGLVVGALCQIAVRQDAIAFAAVDADEMGGNAVPVTLIEHRHFGDHLRLRLRLEDGATLIVRRPAGSLHARDLACAVRPLGASVAWRVGQATAYPHPDG